MNITDFSGATCYSGRQLYEARFVSTLNVKPITNLSTHVKSCYSGNTPQKDLAPSLDDLLTGLLVDGSIIIYRGSIAEGSILFLDQSEALLKRKIESDDVYTYLLIDGSKCYMRDYASYEPKEIVAEGLSEPLSDLIVLSSNEVVLYPNGQGILSPNQQTLLRIEEIYETLKKTTPLHAMVFVKNVANSIDRTNAMISDKLKSDQPLVPLNGDITQANFADLNTSLFSELKMLEPNYMEALFNYYIFPNESGIARKYAMERFLSKTGELKDQCIDIYGRLGFKVDFAPSDVSEFEEDQKKIDSFYSAVDRGVMTIEEASPYIRELLGVF
jgi:hypothetical protein